MIRLLFVVTLILTLWVPLFNRTEPSLFGFPFFYWYQILVVVISSLLTFIVFRVESSRHQGEDE